MMTAAQAAELQIEIRVEKLTDRIDARYMRGEINEQEYHEELRALSDWAESQYSLAGTHAFDPR